MDTLKSIDIAVLQWVNGWNHPILDYIMMGLSDKYLWIPLYLYLIFRIYQKSGKSFWIPLSTVILMIVCTDQITSSLMKPFFERLRPCKVEEIRTWLIVVDGCGGKYGFVSSHAANTMGLAVFFSLFEGRNRFSSILVLWASLVGLSRVYLGVHYPGDVLGGFIVGWLAAWIFYRTSFSFKPGAYS